MTTIGLIVIAGGGMIAAGILALAFVRWWPE
jgi:hypothetical protein